MPRRTRWIMAALMAAVSGAAGVVLLRRRGAASTPEGTATAPEPISTGATSAGTGKEGTVEHAAALPSPTIRGWRIEVVVVMALAGLVCLILAQQSMLQSRWPVTPLALYLAGIPLLLPLVRQAEDARRAKTAQTRPKEHSSGHSSPAIQLGKIQGKATNSPSPYWIAGVFFLLAAALAGRLNPSSPLFGIGWLLGTACFITAGLRLNRTIWAAIWTDARKIFNRIEIIGILAAMAMAVMIQTTTPAPQTQLPSHDAALQSSSLLTETTGPLYRLIERSTADLFGLQQISGIFAVLIVPVVYLLGRRFDGWQAGALAAGLASVSGWTLALGKSGEVFPALAVSGGLVLLTILAVKNSRRAWGVSGVMIGVAALISPLAIGLSVLLPAAAVIEGMSTSSGHSIRARGGAVLRALSRFILPVVIGTAVALPVWVLPRTPVPILQTDYETGLNRAVLFVESGASAALMFNLTGDPSPVHGLVDRPVFGPVLAAAFVTGMIGLAARLGQAEGKPAQLLLIGLAAALIPSALLIDPPYRYPDLQRAAAALPIGTVIAGYGLAQILKVVQERLGFTGLALAAAPLAVALALTAGDAIQHYRNAALPAYEQAAFTYLQLAQPPH